MKKKDALFLGIGAVAIIASAAVVGFAVMNTNDTDDTNLAANSSVSSAATNNSSSSSSTSSDDTSTNSSNSSTSTSSESYADGTYSASTDYEVPRGATNSITASITVANGKITSVSVENSSVDHESSRYIDDFESGVSSSATGKSLADYSPTRIGGASLTTSAFADVLDQIRQDAAA